MISNSLDWILDRTVLPGYSKLGYKARGLASRPVDPDGRLQDRRIAVTGANSGLGEATTKLLAEAGAAVVMVCRDEERGLEAKARISEQTGSDKLELELCDLADLDSVERAAGRLRDDERPLDGLIHNAGMLTDERRRSEQGHELTFAVHVLGPLLLTELLAPKLAESAGRVVFVTSGGMYTQALDVDDIELESRDFDGAKFYAHAKRLQVVLTGELDHRLEDVSVHAMHPGWAGTPGVERSLPTFNKVLRPILRDAEQGADTSAWLMAAERPSRETGRLWMDREPRPEHRVPWTEESPEERTEAYRICTEILGERVPAAA